MSTELLIEILKITGYVLLGGLSLYLKTKETLKEKAAGAIAEAETEYKDVTNAGGAKFECAVEKLYALVPAAFKPVITRAIIGNIIQSVFDSVEAYAKTQLNKIAEKITAGNGEQGE